MSPSENFAETASRIAALVDKSIEEGRIGDFDDDALGQALAALVRLYVAKAESGARLMPVGRNSALTPTEIAIAALALLDAGRMEVFELGLWEQMGHVRPARQTSLIDHKEGAVA
ncbi:hypothetical protein GCM10007276_05220 [Agaricicola taiwanensis]|uniref:Uncharacterized protein n=1 Tax=Agaricicola taiwanensis TaxID=591372 RepID=A0A8J2VL57_9RHOB|nr:hypothetical protein [Agaricicola taiwanensis]GGE30992.1 hypothetical protein GCM10007276_05220 [Agaricicola taiwanensis]